ncbi:MAG: outer membrane protein transport protein [Deltaproteobacteria bacterium]|nr:outer membrane protein transport protein [Deltaproteobacteria bacterium]
MLTLRSQLRCTRPQPRRAVCAALVCATLALGPAAWANVPGTYGFGSRSSALAGAMSADGGDSSSVYYNPAGLLRAEGVRVDVGYFYAHHALNANGLDSQVDPAHGLVAGVVAPGRVFGIPFAFGLATHLPDERLSRSRALPQSQPRWELFDNRVQLLYLAADVAFAPLPYLRLGAGLSFVSSTRGTLDIYGDIAFPNANSSRLRHAVDADLRAVRYAQLGMQVDLHPDLTLAFVYRGEFKLALEIDGLVDGNVVVGSGDNAIRVPGSYSLSSRSTAVFLPQQAVLGLRWTPRRLLTLLLDATYSNYAAYANPTARFDVSLQLTPPPGLNIPIPALPPGLIPTPARFNDTLALRVGVEQRVQWTKDTLALRVGYRFEPTPVPAQTGRDTNFLDSDRHVISLGVGWLTQRVTALRRGWSIDLNGSLSALAPRVYQKLDPTDPVGDQVLGGFVAEAGLTTSLCF